MEEVSMNCVNTATPYENIVVSVVVPVYNTKTEFLRECLDSILNQKFRSYEVILVDDGSTNEAGEICDEYAKKDIRFRVLHKKNQGLPAARNEGILHATGEFMAFVDSDDLLDEEYLEFLVGKAKENFLDVVQCHSLAFYPNGHKIDIMPMSKEASVFTGKEELEELTLYSLNHGYLKERYGFFNPAWGKLIRRQVLVDHNLLFNTKATMVEDQLFHTELLSSISKIGIFRKALYYYRQEEASAVRRFRTHYDKETIELLNFNIQLINERFGGKEVYRKRIYCAACAQFAFLLRAFYYHREWPANRNRKTEMKTFLANPVIRESFQKAEFHSLATAEIKLVYVLARMKVFFAFDILYFLRPIIKKIYISIRKVRLW